MKFFTVKCSNRACGESMQGTISNHDDIELFFLDAFIVQTIEKGLLSYGWKKDNFFGTGFYYCSDDCKKAAEICLKG